MIDRDLHDVRASLQNMTELATNSPSNLAGLLRSCCRQCALSVGHVGDIRQCFAAILCRLSVLLQIDTDVDESKSILSYMRRCCLCFLCACCCDGDKDVARDNTRKKRVKE